MRFKKITAVLVLFLAQPSLAQNYCDIREASRLSLKYKNEGLSALISESERCKSNCSFLRSYLIATNESYCSNNPCIRLEYIDKLIIEHRAELKKLRGCPKINEIIEKTAREV